MNEYSAVHKVPPYTVVELNNRDPRFYELLGPWLSRREIVAELGGAVWDDDDKEWIVAYDDGPVGMVAYRKGWVCSLYVAPGRRGQIVGTTLLLRLVMRHGRSLKAMATPASLRLFEDCGFRPKGTRGRYTVMVSRP